MTATALRTTPHPLDHHVPVERLPFFVYGTLRPSWGNSRLWEGVATGLYDGEAKLPGHVLYSSGIPYVTPGDGTVVGCLVMPHDWLSEMGYRDLMYHLDSLEGVHHDDMASGHYERKAVEVDTPAGKVRAWVYWTTHPWGSIEPSGDYAVACETRRSRW